MENHRNEVEGQITQLIRQKMHENNLMLCYRGLMSQDIIIALLNLTENKLNQSLQNSTIKSRVFSVMVECLQNITQQCDTNLYSRANMFMLGSAEKGYILYSGCVVNKSELSDLKNKIQEINTMSEEDLKKFYKQVMMSDSFSEKQDIDLGLIFIVRKTGNALDFDFEQIDSDHYFFSLSTLIDH